MRSASIIDLIGNTPLMPLRRVVPPPNASVLVKLESTNPAGSMKDRAALAIVRRAAQDGRLKPGDTIVECTSGSTGTSLASVALALGYRCLLVSSTHSVARSSLTCERSEPNCRSSGVTTSGLLPNRSTP